jgi:hypothetical protein
MSVYTVHKLLHRAQVDVEFRERLRSDPSGSIAEWPFSDEERRALLAGDVAAGSARSSSAASCFGLSASTATSTSGGCAPSSTTLTRSMVAASRGGHAGFPHRHANRIHRADLTSGPAGSASGPSAGLR